MATSLDSLRHLETPGMTRFVAGPTGLVRLEITTRLASAHLYLHGAHVTHFQPAGSSPVIFLSTQSKFSPDQAIRGGVPVIFPWFGAHGADATLPAHGFARTSEWEVEGVELERDETCRATLRLVADQHTLALWPHDFILRLRITVGRKLEMALEVENWSGGPMVFEEALHTYLAVRDVHQTNVTGLQGCDYLDKVDGFARKREEAAAIQFREETDRVYVATKGACTVDDAAAGRCLLVAPKNSENTVVWNPWESKAAAMVDMADDEWTRFVCVETANVAEGKRTLAHGEAHIMGVTIGLE